jgi:hypothetical protein
LVPPYIYKNFSQLALYYGGQHLSKSNSSAKEKHQTKVGYFKNPTLVGKEIA